jgi:hypothetical protein
MAYTNIPPNLQDMFYSLDDRIRKLESGPNSAQASADSAYTTALAAQTTAVGAQTTANGKNTVTYSATGPGSTPNTAGDIWWEYTTGGIIIAQWTGAGGTSWTPNTVGSAVIANIDAGKITTGILDASLVTVTTSPSASNSITFSGANTSIDFKRGGSVLGHIIPFYSNGVLMHYGASADPTGGTYPYVAVTNGSATIAASSSVVLGVNTTSVTIAGGLVVSTGDISGAARIATSGATVGTYTTGDIAAGRYFYSPNITTTSSAANLFVGSNGQFIKSTASSERYKENIVDITTVADLDPKKLLDLPVRAFTYKEGELPADDPRHGEMIPGFIAEEVSKVYPIAADHLDGQAESWNERMIVPALLSLVQDLSKRVTELETQLSKP